jgi:DeoR/GlpR family transcriptional regulator of sugar metabolism
MNQEEPERAKPGVSGCNVRRQRLGNHAQLYRCPQKQALSCILTRVGPQITAMLKEDRHRQMLTLLREKGTLMATQLARDFRVSEDTVRRDLQELNDEGHLRRVHGGALSRTPGSPTFKERASLGIEAKTAMGLAAAQLLRAGMTLFLDAGPANLQLARSLPAGMALTLITNSPLIAVELSGNPVVEVIQIGGRLRAESLALVGAEAVEQVHRYRADLVFLGMCAVHRKQGISHADAEEAAVKRAMLGCSSGALAVVTRERLNTTASFVVGSTEKLTHLIVDQDVEVDGLHKFEKLGIQVIRT